MVFFFLLLILQNALFFVKHFVIVLYIDKNVLSLYIVISFHFIHSKKIHISFKSLIIEFKVTQIVGSSSSITNG